MTQLLPITPIEYPTIIPVSNSEIQTFKDCRRKWWLSYYLGLTPKERPITGALVFGTRIHNALEALYKRGESPVEVFLNSIEDTRQELAELGVTASSDLDKDAELGRIMLEGYVDWLEETGADSDLEVTDSEKKITAKILNDQVEVRGKIDLRVRRKTDGARRVLDFKSVANRDTYVKTAHMAEQLKLYIALEGVNDPDNRIDGGLYRLLKKVKRTASAKPPFYEDYEIRHNKKTLESFWYALHGVVQEILDLRGHLDNGADPRQVAYPTPSNDCTWKCPFYAACPMFDDGSAVADYIGDYFEQYDPYQRYEEESD